MLQIIHGNIENQFDIEEVGLKLSDTLYNLSLFSVCLHYFRCARSCDKVSDYCFYCSRVRSHDLMLGINFRVSYWKEVIEKNIFVYIYTERR